MYGMVKANAKLYGLRKLEQGLLLAAGLYVFLAF